MRRMGPLVHRSVHYGAIGLIIAGAIFVVVNAVLPFGYSGFSITANSIGDLGNAAHTSWAWAFDVGMIAFGLVGLAGGFLVWTAFPLKTSRTLGLLLMEAAFVGAIGVGAFPQGSSWTLGSLGSIPTAVLLLGGALALLFLSLAMLRDTRWSGYRLYTLLSGGIGLVAIALLWSGISGSLGPGGLERVALAPFILWLIVAGIHLARIPTYSPPGVSVTA